MKIKTSIFLNIIVLVITALVVVLDATWAQEPSPSPAPCCYHCNANGKYCAGDNLIDCTTLTSGLCVYNITNCGADGCEEPDCNTARCKNPSPSPSPCTCSPCEKSGGGTLCSGDNYLWTCTVKEGGTCQETRSSCGTSVCKDPDPPCDAYCDPPLPSPTPVKCEEEKVTEWGICKILTSYGYIYPRMDIPAIRCTAQTDGEKCNPYDTSKSCRTKKKNGVPCGPSGETTTYHGVGCECADPL